MKTVAVVAGLGVGVLSLALTTPACRKGPPPASGAAPSGAAVRELPKRWAALHLPTDGIQKIQSTTDEHGCTIDYAGSDMAGLWVKVTAALKTAGYVPACNVLDGKVRGFRKGDEKLAVKIDSLGGLVLSIFDAHGKEPLLHGVCFGKYQLGPRETLSPDQFDRAAEEEAAARRTDGKAAK